MSQTPRLPNRPPIDSEDVASLRASVPDQEGELPSGKPYVPTDSDNEPLVRKTVHEIPDFIPQELAVDPSEFLASKQGRVMRNNDPLPPPPHGYPMQEEDDPEAEELMRELRNQNAPSASKDTRQKESVLPNKPTKHPVLTKLLSSFGLERVPVKTKNIGNIPFTFRLISAPNKLVAIRIANLRSETQDELKVNVSWISALLGLVSIDGTSIYEILSMDLTEHEKTMLARDPGNPPAMLVENSAVPLVNVFLNGWQTEVIEEITRTYYELFEGDKDVPSDIGTYQRTHWRFECPKTGCDEFQNRVPKVIDASKGTIEPVFCPVHGVAMNPISTLEEYRSNPLA